MTSKHRKGRHMLVPIMGTQRGGVFLSGLFSRHLLAIPLGAPGSVIHAYRADHREMLHCEIEMRPNFGRNPTLVTRACLRYLLHRQWCE
ncbi:hypothetical protein LZ30DRAFT_598984 [Colletotrichum cereale]|nr:hypothetical protein LZ30DRAFT_598984 [Colletotrichum cereale]